MLNTHPPGHSLRADDASQTSSESDRSSTERAFVLDERDGRAHGTERDNKRPRVDSMSSRLTIERVSEAGSRGSSGELQDERAESAAVRREPVTTLAELSKRGVMVRSSRRLTLSLVGLRFAKAAAWCTNCGAVRCC